MLALLLHIFLGWAWTPIAGLVAGLWKGIGGWWTGGVAVGSSWLAIVGYTLFVAPDASMRLADILASMLGGVPAFLVFVATVALGVVSGTAAGGLGTGIRSLIGPSTH